MSLLTRPARVFEIPSVQIALHWWRKARRREQGQPSVSGGSSPPVPAPRGEEGAPPGFPLDRGGSRPKQKEEEVK